MKLLLTTYFEGVTPNLDTITALPVQGLHVDLVHGKDDVAELHKRLPSDWLLSAGLINGRNVWRADLTEKYAQIKDIVGKRDLWVASSCSLLHSPIDLSVETRLDAEVKSWFAFALQKCHELALLRDALNSGDTAALAEWSAPIQARRHSTRVHNPAVESVWRRSPPGTVSVRMSMKCVLKPSVRVLNCPHGRPPRLFLPQTTEIRTLRLDFKRVISTPITTARALRNISSRPLLSRNVWDWMCWYMARPSVMTWWNTLASTSTGLSLRKTVGYRATVPAA